MVETDKMKGEKSEAQRKLEAANEASRKQKEEAQNKQKEEVLRKQQDEEEKRL